jgi:hypothetical protein
LIIDRDKNGPKILAFTCKKDKPRKNTDKEEIL